MGRWLASVKSDIPRTRDGLLDSATLSRDWYTGDRPRRTEALIGTHSSYVLLAPGGAGKSTLIEELRGREADSVSIDLRLDGRRSIADLLGSLPSDESSPSDLPAKVVFIDAVDEALQVEPDLGYALVRLLQRPGSDRIAWRFACRPGSWTLDLAEGLRAALHGFEELELLPLDLPEIREMAGTGADDFLAEVEDARLTRLLTYPLHASNLLNQWRRTSQLPATRSGAMQYAVTGMLSETSTSRPPGKLDDYRRRLIAERLAAVSIFCGVGNFALGPVAQQSMSGSAQPAAGDAFVLAVSSVPPQTEPDLAGYLPTVDDIREVLGTTLFTAAGQGTVTFVHQSYAEFLAAAYLKRRGVAGQRLVSLLGANVNGLVPGPMIEVLGWLLASGSHVLDTLITDNAKQLLITAGLELIDNEVRKQLVEALLHGAATGTIAEGWNTDTSALSHPDLAAQLHDAAADPSNHWVVFWICSIARQCAVLEAADDLLEIALEPRWPDPIRAEAVKAFAEVAPRDRIAELVPLLDLNSQEDPRDEILAATMPAMLPDAANFDRIRTALRPRRTLNYIGSYSRLLSELPSLVPSDEVVPTLTEALHRRSEHSDSAFDDLIGRLLRRAWDMRNPAIAAVIGEALGSKPLLAYRLSGEDLPWQVDDDPSMRRAMAVAALGAHEDASIAVLDLAILTPADLGWIIDWMRTAPPEALKPARVTLSNLAWDVGDAESAECVLGVGTDHPAYDVLAGFQGSREISSRPDWRSRQLGNNEGPSSTEFESRLRDAIARAHEDVNDWWNVVVALTGDQVDDPEVLLDRDLTRRPMWSTMSSEEQEEFLRLGLKYLDTRRPEVGGWLGRSQWTLSDVMPDWAAVFLLATLLAHRPDLLAVVEPPAWVSWAPAITAIPTYMSLGTGLPGIRDAAPQTGRDAIDEALREQIHQAEGTSFAHHPLADFSDSYLIAAVERVARNADHSEARRGEAISVLIDHAPDIALDVARTTISEDDVPPTAYIALAKLAPDELVAQCTEQNQHGPREHLIYLDLERLSDSSLITLTGMLLDEMPVGADPAHSDDFDKWTPEAANRRLRPLLLHSMAGRGMASSLAALGQGRPAADREAIQHLMQQARAREALMNWQPLPPRTFMDLLASGDARLIRNNAGLLTVLLEQLEQVQHDIHERALFRHVWDGEPGTKGASPKGEDTISDWLTHELRLRLQHIIVDREVQVTRHRAAGVGTRIDITATSGGGDLGRVIFEAKRVNNPELPTAIDDQLVGKYMEPAALTHGIYIIYWITPKLRPPSWPEKYPDAKALTEELRAQARSHLPDKHIEVVVLDIGSTS
ncbi:hypothetical protein OIE68_46190 [Nocardia vinacea]|uniref:hypothetical protein n=1 Tax=Nocardia vinacea TaxID=96468 RepID=UPI002E154ACC|nr:hypothetical protein OIE68_46190 [Nocardia vinacea]